MHDNLCMLPELLYYFVIRVYLLASDIRRAAHFQRPPSASPTPENKFKSVYQIAELITLLKLKPLETGSSVPSLKQVSFRIQRSFCDSRTEKILFSNCHGINFECYHQDNKIY